MTARIGTIRDIGRLSELKFFFETVTDGGKGIEGEVIYPRGTEEGIARIKRRTPRS